MSNVELYRCRGCFVVFAVSNDEATRALDPKDLGLSHHRLDLSVDCRGHLVGLTHETLATFEAFEETETTGDQ